MIVVRAPEYKDYPFDNTIFLGGGISGCPEWQTEMIDLLRDTNAVIYDPRRADYSDSLEVAKEQITWEYNYLIHCEEILFWFPKETICPITLFELGRWSMLNKPIYVGCHPQYSRLFDVQTQMALVRPDLKICSTLVELAEQVKASPLNKI